MRRLFMSIIIAVVTVSSLAKDVLKVGYFENKPHIYAEGQKTEGALVEFMEQNIAPGMGCDIEWVGPIPPARLFTMLETGEINAVALIMKNPEREKKYDYPELAFMETACGIAVLKDGSISSIASLDVLSGKTIAFFNGGYIPEAVKKLTITWDYISSNTWKTQGLEKLLLKRVDGVYDAEVNALIFEVNSNPKFKSGITVFSLPQTEANVYTVFSKKDNGKYVTLYNNTLKKVTVKYKDILEKKLNK